MKLLLISIVLGLSVSLSTLVAQNRVLYNAFSHNDYEQNQPLFDALSYGYNNVEADIHLINNELIVSHDLPTDESKFRTLEELYLKPLSDRIKQQGGVVFNGSSQPFYFMIDFKSEGEATYKILQPLLEKYKDILCSVEGGMFKERAVLLFISGNRPIKTISEQKIRYAFVDGRMADLDKNEPSLLMPVISDNYKLFFQWKGEGEMPAKEQEKLQSFVTKAHAQGKKIRFWGAPLTDALKRTFIRQKIDLIGEDHLEDLPRLLNNLCQ